MPWPALVVPPPWLVATAPLPVDKFTNNLAPNVPTSILKNPSFCSFASFLIVPLTLLIYNPDSSRDLIIFMISFISLFEIINIVLPDSNIFLWIIASVADAAVNPNGIKMLLANGPSAFPIKGNLVFSNGPKKLPKNHADCPIFCSWVFDNFIFVDEPRLYKALKMFY